MMTSKKRAIGLLALALTLVAAASFARAQGQGIASNPAAPSSMVSTPEQKPSDLKALHDPALQQKTKDVLTALSPERRRLDQEYREAAALFPSFCKDWEQKLRDREANNIEHLVWKLENGLQTALYTSYSKIESCETHQSPQGFSIGKLSYEEFHYLIKAKTPDEAKQTKGTQVDDTHTTEIFRWDKGKWFY
ncbi:MAG: hypothetical protein KGM92_00560 [Acidobacteriota bacterium]|nr:hypothetical protein [Acidobacteriota bacterium]